MFPVIQDKIGQAVELNDVIYSYNEIYVVKKIGRMYVKAILKDPSPTTRNKTIYYKDFVVITKLLEKE